MDLSQLDNPGQYAIENVSRKVKEVTIRDCSVQHNRARSLLLSCAGKVKVENCDFGSMMAGIRICGDANYWFESGRTEDITISGCKFRNLGIGGASPQAILQIDWVLGKYTEEDMKELQPAIDLGVEIIKRVLYWLASTIR